MKKEKLQKQYCGIDVSGDTIDVCYTTSEGTMEWSQFENSKVGFQKLHKLCGSEYHYVMESTGVYHLPLAFYLQHKSCKYSVVNALQIKRFIQMNLERNKSDKKDAFHICNYGIMNDPEVYEMPERQYFECK